MTKKHFRALAEALHNIQPTLSEPNSVASAHKWSDCVQAIANVCASQNPRFDRARFIEACVNGLNKRKVA